MNSEVESKFILSCILTKAKTWDYGNRATDADINKATSFFKYLCKYGCPAQVILDFLQVDPEKLKKVLLDPIAFTATLYAMGCPISALIKATHELSNEYDI